MKATWLGMLGLAVLLTACGDDDGDGNGNGGGGGSSNADVQICYDVCAAQDAAEMAGNCPGLGLSTCRLLCDGVAGGDCWSELTALNGCWLTGEFDCGLISAESDAMCDAEAAAYDTCASESNQCEGANDEGFCPAVPCDCPDGATSISGFISEGGSCACVDSTTCMELCF